VLIFFKCDEGAISVCVFEDSLVVQEICEFSKLEERQV
jgi:hypothetical protein